MFIAVRIRRDILLGMPTLVLLIPRFSFTSCLRHAKHLSISLTLYYPLLTLCSSSITIPNHSSSSHINTAQASAAASVELSSISDSHIPLQQIPMQVPPQHFQDPHATAGVPGYPYPPPQQFYPAMYMNQV